MEREGSWFVGWVGNGHPALSQLPHSFCLSLMTTGATNWWSHQHSILHPSFSSVALINNIHFHGGRVSHLDPIPRPSIPSGYHSWYPHMHTYVLKHFKRVEYECRKPWVPSWFWWQVVEGFSKLELVVINTIKYPPNTSLFFMESGHACMHGGNIA